MLINLINVSVFNLKIHEFIKQRNFVPMLYEDFTVCDIRVCKINYIPSISYISYYFFSKTRKYLYKKSYMI